MSRQESIHKAMEEYRGTHGAYPKLLRITLEAWRDLVRGVGNPHSVSMHFRPVTYWGMRVERLPSRSDLIFAVGSAWDDLHWDMWGNSEVI